MVLLCLQLVIELHKTPPCCMLHSFPQKSLLFFRLTTFVQSVTVIKYYLQIFQAFFACWKDNFLFRSGFANPNVLVKSKCTGQIMSEFWGIRIWFGRRRNICEICKMN